MVETSSSGVPEQAQAAKDEAINQAGVLKETALEHVGTLTSDAKDRATDVARDVRRELESQGDSQAKRAASMLHDVGTQLTDMASGAEPGPVQQVTRQLADKSRQVATRLDEDGVQGVGDDLRRFARRQPGLFLAAAGLAGFVVTRVLRNAQSGGLANGNSDATTDELQAPPVVAASPATPVSALGTDR